MQEPKKRGRPPKPAAERRRHNQTFRCNDEMLAKLQEAADKNQRSISEEVERRIDESFSNEKVISEFKLAAYSASEKAWEDYVKTVAGEQRFLAFGLDAASTLRYAMRDLNVFDKKLSDIADDPEYLNHIKNVFDRQMQAILKWPEKSDFDVVLEINKRAMQRNIDKAIDEEDSH